VRSALRTRKGDRRRGVALMMTLGAIAVIGALVVGVLFSTLLERRNALAQLLRARALDAAELALADVISPAMWDSSWTVTPSHGVIAIRAHSVGAADAIDSIRVTKLASRLFLVVSDARVGMSPLAFARRRVSMIVVLDSAQHPVPALAHAWLELPR
jgi:hypothetical protein